MQELYVALGLLVLGFVILLKGSEWFVQAAARIAGAFGVSEFVVGLTLVAFGTSVPELASSIVAAQTGSIGLILGNVFGSNIANIGLVIGFAALISNMKITSVVYQREGYVLLLATALIGAFLYFGQLGVIACILFLVLYFAYSLYLFEEVSHDTSRHPFAAFMEYFSQFGYVKTVKRLINNDDESESERPTAAFVLKEAAICIIGLIGVILGARFLVDGSLLTAGYFGLSEGAVGATIVALGTSLPELLVTITAARKNLASLALGNILGSNIANLLLILGVSGLIAPIDFAGTQMTYLYMLVITIVFVAFIRSADTVEYKEGIALLSLYLGFMLASLLGVF